MMALPIIIAIDGLASSGKSTIARQIAAALHYRYIDSGAFYRAVTLYLLNHHVDWTNDAELRKSLKEIDISFSDAGGKPEIFLNGKGVEKEIREIRISESVSDVSKLQTVRNFISGRLREYGINKSIVMDGRDIGTVVFPDAELKIYLTADQDIRSERRFSEMKKEGSEVTMDRVYQNLAGRDLTDTTRETAPLRKAPDAVVLDNTHLSLHDQFEVVLQLAREKIDWP
ncbi:MAG: (d)CMP kinase [Chitinophagales bacterium]